MRKALDYGLAKKHRRLQRFNASDVGSSIDMGPFIEMMESASSLWREALDVVEAICSAHTIEDCIATINSALALNIQSKDEIDSTLEYMEMEKPTLLTSLIKNTCKLDCTMPLAIKLNFSDTEV